MAQKTIPGIIFIVGGILFFIFRKQWAKHAEKIYKIIAVKKTLENIAIAVSAILIIGGIILLTK